MAPLPSRAEILGFIAKNEPLDKTLERFPGLTREHLRALLREAALLMRAEEQGAEASGPDLPPQRPLVPAPAPRPAPVGPQAPRPERGEAEADRPRPKATSGPTVEDLAPATAEGASGRKKLLVYSDGAARGNPGPAGAGAVLTRPDGTLVSKAGKFLGTATNNVAEYTALLLGLETALRLGAEEVEVVADSELLVRQLNGVYKVKNAGLKPLFEQAKAMLGRFAKWTARHVPREQNKLADEMSNRAIDEKL
ncbi:MAG TPA: ribonuclease HI family protein [Myxococcales bacterium]|jgi:ribonuclease HI